MCVTHPPSLLRLVSAKGEPTYLPGDNMKIHFYRPKRAQTSPDAMFGPLDKFSFFTGTKRATTTTTTTEAAAAAVPPTPPLAGRPRPHQNHHHQLKQRRQWQQQQQH
jgi:hypothetical protein